MDRTNLARAAVVSAGCLVLILAPAAAADPAAPVTITFTGSGTVPLVCGSKPDITSLTVARGQAVILANLTGAEATVDVGAKAPLTLASGTGVSVKLATGEHVLRMVPKCLLVGEVGQAVVMVVPGSPAGPTPGGTEPSGRAPGAPMPTGPMAGQSGAAALVSAGASGQPSPTTGPGATSAPGPVPGPGGDDPEATPVPIVQPADERGIRLVAIVAAICVLGVTAGIIRAIVTHRTRVSLRTMSTK